MSDFVHLNLEDWPFQVVPSEEAAKIWVGRPEFERKLRGLLSTVQRVNPSRIVLLWAAYGAGKTHALRYLTHLASEDEDVRALYVVTPKGIKHFLDVYRAVVDAALRSDLISELGLALYKRSGPEQPTNLRRALVRIVSLNEPQTRTPVAWLKAEKISATELRSNGLTRRLETSADGIDTLNEFVELLRTELGVKLMLLLDEIQELGELAPRQLDEAVGGLHKVFDRNTEGLTLVFSFTTAARDTVEAIIGRTLYERRSDVLTLPALSTDEGVAFIEGLIASHSIDEALAPFPFTPAAVRAVVEQVPSPDGFTPRELIRAFDAIMRDAEMDVQDGVLKELTSAEALNRAPA
jgi:hypothetical protein